MILLQKAGRVDKICAAHGIEYVGDGDARGQQLCGIGHDLELRLLTTLHDHRGNPVQTIKARLHLVGSHFPEPGLRRAVRGDAVGNDGKRREGQPVGPNHGGWRKLRLNSGNGCIDVLQGLEHVDVPAEIEVDFRRAAAGHGAYGQQAGNAVDRFFERARNGDHHLIDGHHAVVNANQYPREVRLGKYGDGDGEG